MKLLPVFCFILLLAFFSGSHSLFYLFYILVGLVVLSRLWIKHALPGLAAQRHFPARAFYGEEVAVELEIVNRGWLPLLWVMLRESLPLELHTPTFEQRVVSLAPRERTALQYRLTCRRRGYYTLGPLVSRTGDFLGLAHDEVREQPGDVFIVYPKIIPLRRLELPSQLPFGTVASRQRFFEDPSRFLGVRDYEPGDSLRQIHWTSSARAGKLQVKRYQPAIALHTLVFLDLNLEAYLVRNRVPATELGVVIAASVAAYLSQQRQPVGLALLGRDAVTDQSGLQVIPPGRGREHLMRLLETLARAEAAPTAPLAPLLAQATAGLGWGSTVVVITAGEAPELWAALLQLRRRGCHVLLVATDMQPAFPAFQARLAQIGVPACWFTSEKDLELWQ